MISMATMHADHFPRLLTKASSMKGAGDPEIEFCEDDSVFISYLLYFLIITIFKL